MSSKTHPVPVKTELEGGLVRYDFDVDYHAARLFKNLQSAQSSGSSLCDVTLVTTDGHEVPFHAVLLAASSSIFRRQMTALPMGIEKKIKVPMEVEVLKVIRDSIYTSKVTITPENVQGVKMAAKMYKLNFLHQICLRYEENDESEEDEKEDVGDSAVGRSHHAKILTKVEGLFTKGEFATVTIQDDSGDGEISCHAPMLAAASSVFHQLLSSKDSGPTLCLEEVTHDAIEEILNFVYTASVVVASDNAQALLMAACRYGLPEISEACCDWLSADLDADNALGIYWLARRMEGNYCDQLLEEAKAFILENFMEVKGSEDFENLSLEELIEIIADDELNIGSEEDVVHAVMKWFACDKAQHLQHLPTLLQCTRLEHTSLEFLETLLLDPDIQESPECTTIVEDVKNILAKALSPAPTPERDQYFDIDAVFEPPTPYSIRDKLQYRPRRLRKDGQLDMRFKENRDELLPSGRNKDGALDKRTKEYKEMLKKCPKRKDGRPDMRFKVNRDLLLGNVKDGKQTTPEAPLRTTGVPLKKDGTPDKRFKVNRKLFGDSAPERTHVASVLPKQPSGPLKKDGSPDMRYAVNRQLQGTAPCSRASLESCNRLAGPRKKDGTPDMRFAVNRESRSGVGGSHSSASAFSATAAGPLKADGTPDMRYAANKASSGRSGPPLSNGSSYGSSSTYKPSGPLKSDGTPDMRYAANKASYGNRGPSPSSGRSYGSSSTYRASGPLKSNGTPDMRYKANR